MNINKLKQKSQVKIYSHGAFGEDEINYKLDTEKFAELIIKECIRLVSEPSGTPEYKIKNYFGIDE